MSQLPVTTTESSPSTATQEKVKIPTMYKVVLLNDDFTPMDFVVHVLKKFFKKTDPEANEIMLKIHSEGKGIAGVYTYEIAEMKVDQVNNYSRRNRHPLKTVLEEE
jgi:ATP-dependent Clp protease adaptor protein ClpS